MRIVFRVVEREARREHICNIDAGVDPLECDEAAADEPRADEHQERDRDLRDDEHAPYPEIAARS